MKNKLNIIFMGEFSYPLGMAGTKRIHHAIKALNEYPEVTTRVILQRQSSKENTLSGIHEGTPYETVLGDLLRIKMILSLPLLYYRTIRSLKRAFRPSYKNIIYYYGSPAIESILPLWYARGFGYKIVFDIVEDHEVAKEISKSVYHRSKMFFMRKLFSTIKDLAAGIIVISSHLEKKCRRLADKGISVHFRPISVDTSHFPEKEIHAKSNYVLFYSGSFGKKDGLPLLIKAFDKLAEKRKNIRLVLTGKGDKEAMEEFYSIIATSTHRDRIEYLGYVDENSYHSILNSIDIPCMCRIDLAYANAGFPFKLGEYLATGKPVVASIISDVKTYLVNRKSAMLVSSGESEEIYRAVEYLMDNLEAADSIGREGRKIAERFFDFRSQGALLLKYLKCV